MCREPGRLVRRLFPSPRLLANVMSQRLRYPGKVPLRHLPIRQCVRAFSFSILLVTSSQSNLSLFSVTTTEKILAFAKAASIPIHCTTQTVAKLGPTVPSIAAHLTSTPIDKTNFSMLVPELTSQLKPKSSVAIVGIESHICVTQTALDLRDAGHSVYIIADAVSSCNRQEVVVALDRLRAEQGITVTSSESWMYETLGDAGHPAFKSVIGIVKNSIADTKRVLESLPPISKI